MGCQPPGELTRSAWSEGSAAERRCSVWGTFVMPTSGFHSLDVLRRPVAMGGDSRDARASSSGNKAAPASFYCPISMVRALHSRKTLARAAGSGTSC